MWDSQVRPEKNGRDFERLRGVGAGASGVTGSEPWDDYPYRVVSTALVTPVIRELWLAPQGPELPYRPGQYVLLSDRDYRIPQRSYSVANAPRPDGQVSLLVTRVPNGPTSTWVHDELRVGDPVLLSGPYGTFVLDDPASSTLLLGAGSGLAPIRALAEALLDNAAGPVVALVFSARTVADTIDRARFRQLGRRHAKFHTTVTLTRDPAAPWHERVPDLLPRIYPDLRGWQVFTAGPPGFVIGCAAAARALGADPEAVHTEEFFTDPQPWTGLPPTRSAPVAGRPE